MSSMPLGVVVDSCDAFSLSVRSSCMAPILSLSDLGSQENQLWGKENHDGGKAAINDPHFELLQAFFDPFPKQHNMETNCPSQELNMYADLSEEGIQEWHP